MKQFSICFLLVTWIYMLPAQANFFIEPAVTYEQSTDEIDWPTPFTNSTGNTTGLGANIKVGVHALESFFAALDVSYSKPNFENSVSNYDANATSFLYGVVGGAQMPIVGLRLWGGYVLGGEMDPDKSGTVDAKFSGAKGPKVGVGFRILMFSVNLEYSDLKYDKAEVTEDTLGEAEDEMTHKMTTLSFSFPFTL
ncbi:hypothetical protein [Bdellovibrio reynosensis]|uniref:Outer membrane protein beta-barrel domain-containing protein n=1 Tax=Bdellovibrio reynosensis TaxID=2835041 RepID=A0ABY4CE33_9BACT|nr:hypothetical protein [Bdellovibrio reynosensis]UOF01798.1 hypothetical protein MNR06_02375 [Bdellovibrio reynosensis]